MSLTRRFQYLFLSALRERGEQYAREGRVAIIAVGEGEAEAAVRGKLLYDTWVAWSNYGLEHECTCPAYEDFGICKHVWAVLVTLDGGPSVKPQPRHSLWRSRLALQAPQSKTPLDWPAGRETAYVLERIRSGRAQLHLSYRDRKKNGDWTVLKEWRPRYAHLQHLPDPADREALTLLTGGYSSFNDYRMSEDQALEHTFILTPPLAAMLLPAIARRGRLYFKVDAYATANLLAWDDGDPFTVTLDVEPSTAGWNVAAHLRRKDEVLGLNEAAAIFECGLAAVRGKLTRVEIGNALPLVDALRRDPVVEVPAGDTPELLAHLAENVPDLLGVVPDALRLQHENPPCRPLLRVNNSPVHGLSADVLFDYDGRRVPYDDSGSGIFIADERRLLRRNAEQEQLALAQLPGLGFRRDHYAYGERARLWLIPANRFPHAARALVQQGWVVEADGRAFRPAGAVQVRVSSGIDWFELDGNVEYGDTSASLMDVLKALRQKEQFVRLGDGSLGLLPEEWLARYGPLVSIGATEDQHLRFRKSQAGLLDALLSALPEATWDEAFAEVRQKLLRFTGIAPAPQPPGFEGQLRPYQAEGLGWLLFLRDYGFGGCLADDMGLGKTAQVLAYLETRRDAGAGPSLVVVPRSLIFNWRQEATRFTPKLRILDYSGAQRGALKLEECDIVLSTYGTLRRDVVDLREHVFDTVVLDEAQAIKNHNTEAAKAARLLRGEHRLALSGTPIENHLGELWSLFEFLNPGLLGSARAFQGLAGKTAVDDPTARHLLAHALRPFILRRTKEQVARDLPAKTEQTIYCDLEGPQRKLYNQLLDHYRSSARQGRSQRPGQIQNARPRGPASPPPGRLPPRPGGPRNRTAASAQDRSPARRPLRGRRRGPQGPRLLPVHLPARPPQACPRRRRIPYEYLDGQTARPPGRVERFQTDPACPLFLISLKAGGLGLNLTAAEYVYLLDPWWNPAVEAQAIDRTHRIGQTRHVFAYRLVARNTVEEKILELQTRKRDLAAAIITEDNAVLKKLTREDLELLLS
jgi:hypothetical protein